MPLPKQTLPIFELTVPSTKKKVKFRQFTVREEKILVQAQESEDIAIVKNAVKEIITECVKGLDDVEKLTLFDIEYIMTRLRAKSVGEKIDLSMPCEKDGTHPPIPVRIDLTTIEVTFPPEHSTKIELYDDVGIVMKYPNISNVDKFEKMTSLDTIVSLIDYIYTKEEIYSAEEQTREELVSFLESLTKKQLEKIDEVFFKSMPVFKHEVTYKCPECGHEHNKIVKGLSNFLA